MRILVSILNAMRPTFRLFFFLFIFSGSAISPLYTVRTSFAQQSGSISSKHILLLMPSEREYLGRQLIADLERCYEFMDSSSDGSLPRRVTVKVDWDQSDSSCDRNKAFITIGMNHLAATMDAKGFLFNSAAREIARLALIELSNGAEREDTEFLFEGMIEILVHEFTRSSRSLDAAWAFSHYLDEMHLLGLSTQRSWSTFSKGECSLRTAAPGITFLTTLRDLHDRRRPIKLFEHLKKNSLLASLSLAFDAPVSDSEALWLERVRSYKIPKEITVKDETAPRLLRTVLHPDSITPASALHLQLFIEDREFNLFPDSIFIKDGRTGHLLPVQKRVEKDAAAFTATIEIDEHCSPGQFSYEVIAIDESGNLRRWNGSYTVRDTR